MTSKENAKKEDSKDLKIDISSMKLEDEAKLYTKMISDYEANILDIWKQFISKYKLLTGDGLYDNLPFYTMDHEFSLIYKLISRYKILYKKIVSMDKIDKFSNYHLLFRYGIKEICRDLNEQINSNTISSENAYDTIDDPLDILHSTEKKDNDITGMKHNLFNTIIKLDSEYRNTSKTIFKDLEEKSGYLKKSNALKLEGGYNSSIRNIQTHRKKRHRGGKVKNKSKTYNKRNKAQKNHGKRYNKHYTHKKYGGGKIRKGYFPRTRRGARKFFETGVPAISAWGGGWGKVGALVGATGLALPAVGVGAAGAAIVAYNIPAGLNYLFTSEKVISLEDNIKYKSNFEDYLFNNFYSGHFNNDVIGGEYDFFSKHVDTGDGEHIIYDEKLTELNKSLGKFKQFSKFLNMIFNPKYKKRRRRGIGLLLLLIAIISVAATNPITLTTLFTFLVKILGAFNSMIGPAAFLNGIGPLNILYITVVAFLYKNTKIFSKVKDYLYNKIHIPYIKETCEESDELAYNMNTKYYVKFKDLLYNSKDTERKRKVYLEDNFSEWYSQLKKGEAEPINNERKTIIQKDILEEIYDFYAELEPSYKYNENSNALLGYVFGRDYKDVKQNKKEIDEIRSKYQGTYRLDNQLADLKKQLDEYDEDERENSKKIITLRKDIRKIDTLMKEYAKKKRYFKTKYEKDIKKISSNTDEKIETDLYELIHDHKQKSNEFYDYIINQGETVDYNRFMNILIEIFKDKFDVSFLKEAYEKVNNDGLSQNISNVPETQVGGDLISVKVRGYGVVNKQAEIIRLEVGGDEAPKRLSPHYLYTGTPIAIYGTNNGFYRIAGMNSAMDIKDSNKPDEDKSIERAYIHTEDVLIIPFPLAKVSIEEKLRRLHVICTDWHEDIEAVAQLAMEESAADHGDAVEIKAAGDAAREKKSSEIYGTAKKQPGEEDEAISHASEGEPNSDLASETLKEISAAPATPSAASDNNNNNLETPGGVNFILSYMLKSPQLYKNEFFDEIKEKVHSLISESAKKYAGDANKYKAAKDKKQAQGKKQAQAQAQTQAQAQAQTQAQTQAQAKAKAASSPPTSQSATPDPSGTAPPGAPGAPAVPPKNPVSTGSAVPPASPTALTATSSALSVIPAGSATLSPSLGTGSGPPTDLPPPEPEGWMNNESLYKDIFNTILRKLYNMITAQLYASDYPILTTTTKKLDVVKREINSIIKGGNFNLDYDDLFNEDFVRKLFKSSLSESFYDHLKEYKTDDQVKDYILYKCLSNLNIVNGLDIDKIIKDLFKDKFSQATGIQALAGKILDYSLVKNLVKNLEKEETGVEKGPTEKKGKKGNKKKFTKFTKAEGDQMKVSLEGTIQNWLKGLGLTNVSDPTISSCSRTLTRVVQQILRLIDSDEADRICRGTHKGKQLPLRHLIEPVAISDVTLEKMEQYLKAEFKKYTGPLKENVISEFLKLMEYVVADDTHIGTAATSGGAAGAASAAAIPSGDPAAHGGGPTAYDESTYESLVIYINKLLDRDDQQLKELFNDAGWLGVNFKEEIENIKAIINSDNCEGLVEDTLTYLKKNINRVDELDGFYMFCTDNAAAAKAAVKLKNETHEIYKNNENIFAMYIIHLYNSLLNEEEILSLNNELTWEHSRGTNPNVTNIKNIEGDIDVPFKIIRLKIRYDYGDLDIDVSNDGLVKIQTIHIDTYNNYIKNEQLYKINIPPNKLDARGITIDEQNDDGGAAGTSAADAAAATHNITKAKLIVSCLLDEGNLLFREATDMPDKGPGDEGALENKSLLNKLKKYIKAYKFYRFAELYFIDKATQNKLILIQNSATDKDLLNKSRNAKAINDLLVLRHPNAPGHGGDASGLYKELGMIHGVTEDADGLLSNKKNAKRLHHETVNRITEASYEIYTIIHNSYSKIHTVSRSGTKKKPLTTVLNIQEKIDALHYYFTKKHIFDFCIKHSLKDRKLKHKSYDDDNIYKITDVELLGDENVELGNHKLKRFGSKVGKYKSFKFTIKTEGGIDAKDLDIDNYHAIYEGQLTDKDIIDTDNNQAHINFLNLCEYIHLNIPKFVNAESNEILFQDGTYPDWLDGKNKDEYDYNLYKTLTDLKIFGKFFNGPNNRDFIKNSIPCADMNIGIEKCTRFADNDIIHFSDELIPINNQLEESEEEGGEGESRKQGGNRIIQTGGVNETVKRIEFNNYDETIKGKNDEDVNLKKMINMFENFDNLSLISDTKPLYEQYEQYEFLYKKMFGSDKIPLNLFEYKQLIGVIIPLFSEKHYIKYNSEPFDFLIHHRQSIRGGGLPPGQLVPASSTAAAATGDAETDDVATDDVATDDDYDDKDGGPGAAAGPAAGPAAAAAADGKGNDEYDSKEKYQCISFDGDNDTGLIQHTEIFKTYTDTVYYYSLTKLLLSHKDHLYVKLDKLIHNNIGNIESILNTFTSVLVKAKILNSRKSYKQWLINNNCEEYITVLESTNIRGNMDVLESLATLNEKNRSEQKKIVIRGRSKASIDNLERAIIQINKEFKEQAEYQKNLQETSEAARNKRKAEKEKRDAEKKRKEEEDKNRILKLREENSKREQDELNKLKEQREKGTAPVKEPVVEKTKEDKPKEKLTKDEKSFYEMLFGKQETKKFIKDYEYKPEDDKRTLKIDEDQLKQYKDYEKKVKSQKKDMSHMKQNYKKQLTSLLKKIEYQERTKQDIYESKQRDIKRISDKIEKDSEKTLEIIKEKKKQLKQIQKDIHEQQQLLKKTKLSPDNKKQIHRLLKKYDGTPESLSNIIKNLRLLTKKKKKEKKKNMRVKETKRKYKPRKGDIIIAEKPRDILISSN